MPESWVIAPFHIKEKPMVRWAIRMAVGAFGAALCAAPASAQPIEVCKLVPKEEVKRHLPWIDLLDQLPVEEEAIGSSGSSCNYASVFVQVLPFSQSFIDSVGRNSPLEQISGVGDEAYFRNNDDTYAELMVRVGPRLLTLQANGEGKMDTVKAQAIELAKVYVAALR
jgi:hypothetical protein